MKSLIAETERIPKKKRIFRYIQYTPIEVAEMLGVSVHTIFYYKKKGYLQFVRSPSGRFNRILRSELLRFLRERGIEWCDRTLRMNAGPIVVFTQNPDVKTACKHSERTVLVDCWVDLGIAIAESEPAGVVVDVACGTFECVQTALRLHIEPHRPELVLLTHADAEIETGGFDTIVRLPDELAILPQVFQYCRRS